MYMAPELCVGSRHAQPSSDVFSLGVIAHELLTRGLPSKEPAIAVALRQENPRLQTSLRSLAGLAENLAQLFERCLSIDAAQRPTAAEIARALREWSRDNSGAGAAPKTPAS
jgi:serine/threonine protein kinase